MSTFFPDQWWRDHDNLILVTGWLAENGYDAAAVAYAVEKPWKYEGEFYAAKYDLDDYDMTQVMEDWENSDGEITIEQMMKAYAAYKARGFEPPELVKAQEDAWEALKAAAPEEHAAHCAAIAYMSDCGHTTESVQAAKAALDAFHAAAPDEYARYEALTSEMIQAQLDAPEIDYSKPV